LRWLVLVWLASLIFFGAYVNNFRLPKNKFLVAIGGFIKGLKKLAFGLAALFFGGLLAYAIAASFLGPLREGYGSLPNLYWLLLIIPMLTAIVVPRFS